MQHDARCTTEADDADPATETGQTYKLQTFLPSFLGHHATEKAFCGIMTHQHYFKLTHWDKHSQDRSNFFPDNGEHFAVFLD